jgi:hypothetical protein
MNEANFTSQITQNQLFQEERVRQERMLAEQQLAQLRSLNVEDEDKMKIDQFLSTFQEGVEKKIKKNYKSPMEYIRTEFNRDISLLKDALVSSDVYRNAIHNKTVMNAVRNDIKEGLVSMGQIGRTPEGGVAINSIESQLSEWRQGKRDRLEYSGSYKTPTKYYNELQSQFGQDRFTKERVAPDAVLGAIQAYDGLGDKEAMYEFYRRGLDRTPLYYKYEDQYELEKYQLDRQVKKSQIARNTSGIQADRSQIALNNAQMRELMSTGVNIAQAIGVNVVADNSLPSLVKGGDPLTKKAVGKYSDEVLSILAQSSGALGQDKDKGFVLKDNAKLYLGTDKMNKSLKNVPSSLIGQPVKFNGVVSRARPNADGSIDNDNVDLYLSVTIPMREGFKPKGLSNFDKSGTKRFVGGSTVTRWNKAVNKGFFDGRINPFTSGMEDRYQLEEAFIKIEPHQVEQMMLNRRAGSFKVQDTITTTGAPEAPWNPR